MRTFSSWTMGVVAYAGALASVAAGEVPRAWAQDCPLIACLGGPVLTVGLAAAEGWPAGKYQFSVMHDGSRTDCWGELPDQQGQRATTVCSRPSVDLEVNVGGPPSALGFSEIRVGGGPRRVSIRVRQNGRTITRRRFRIRRYESAYGRGCSGCAGAHVTMALRLKGFRADKRAGAPKRGGRGKGDR